MKCAIHPDRNGNYLCLSCGNWYCQSCMAQIQPIPICNRCAGKVSNTQYKPNDKILEIPNYSILQNKKLIPLLIGGSFLSSVIFFLGGIVFLDLLYLPAVITLLGGIGLGFFSYRKRNKMITEAQLATLIRITNNRITVNEAVKHTGLTEKQVRNSLKKYIGEGKLYSDVDGLDHVFKQYELDKIPDF